MNKSEKESLNIREAFLYWLVFVGLVFGVGGGVVYWKNTHLYNVNAVLAEKCLNLSQGNEGLVRDRQQFELWEPITINGKILEADNLTTKRFDHGIDVEASRSTKLSIGMYSLDQRTVADIEFIGECSKIGN